MQIFFARRTERVCGGADTYVHNPAVDIAKFFEAKQPRAMCRVIEGKALNAY